MASDKIIVLITGASSGIGFDTAIALAQGSPKYHVLVGSRSVEKGQKALDEIQSLHGKSLQGTLSLLQIDITDQSSVDAARQNVETTYGRLDILVNNAGIIVYRETDMMTKLHETFATNTFGPARVTNAFVPLLQKATDPRLIYVSSDQGSVTLKMDSNYVYYRLRAKEYRMRKAALNMLAACHVEEFEEWGCKVCAYNPGYTVTNLTGEEGRKRRIDMGAKDSRTVADALVGVIDGKRDADIEKRGLVDVEDGIIPW